jgi:hypothetical protein
MALGVRVSEGSERGQRVEEGEVRCGRLGQRKGLLGVFTHAHIQIDRMSPYQRIDPEDNVTES